MEGIGEVYSRYRNGLLESDDEVALICDPVTNTALSEALVNIRITLEKARSEEIIDENESSKLLISAKNLYYPDRTWGQVIRSGAISPEKTEKLRLWLTNNRVDQKKKDALMALTYIREMLNINQ